MKWLNKLKSKDENKKNALTKSEGFILILVLLAFYLINTQSDYLELINKFSNHIFGRIDSMERENKALYKAVESLIKRQNKNDTLLEEICTSIIENANEPAELAKGYDCLANLEAKKNDPAAIYRAIRNESYALDAFYDEKYYHNLFAIINQGFEKEASLDLNKLSQSSNTELRLRALYRMSLINSMGRSSSLEKYNYDLKQASNLRNQVLQETNLTKRKPINIVFSLNNSDKYMQYAKMAIASILLNADLDSSHNFYIIMDHEAAISEANKAELNSLQHISSYKTEFKTLPKEILSNKKGFSDIKTRLLFSRFIIENLLPELDSVISLDVDIIVLHDLYNLQYKQNIEKFVLAGVAEWHRTEETELCKFPDAYINAGVIVQNLRLMRQIGNSNLVIKTYQNAMASKDSKCLDLLDQDVINLLYGDKLQLISKRWNYIPALNYSTKSMPFIIHYAGIKPWVFRTLPFEYLKLLNIKYREFVN